MGIAGQIFIIFMLVMLIAFLVSIGINYSIRTQIERTMPNQPKLLEILGRGEDSLDESLDIRNIEHDIHKFEKLGGPDIIANQAAIDEMRDRLHHRIDEANLSEQTRVNLKNDVDRIHDKLRRS